MDMVCNASVSTQESLLRRCDHLNCELVGKVEAAMRLRVCVREYKCGVNRVADKIATRAYARQVWQHPAGACGVLAMVIMRRDLHTHRIHFILFNKTSKERTSVNGHNLN